MSKFIPCYEIPLPNSNIQKSQITIKNDEPVYSCYTSQLIGYGPIPYGTKTDALPIHNGYGKDYHVVELIYGKNGQYYSAHRVNNPSNQIDNSHKQTNNSNNISNNSFSPSFNLTGSIP